MSSTAQFHSHSFMKDFYSRVHLTSSDAVFALQNEHTKWDELS